MSQLTLEDLTHRVNLDLTGVLMDLGFTYVGRCHCSNCYMDKYKNKNVIIRLCRQRLDFDVWDGGTLKVKDKFTTLPKYLYEIYQKTTEPI